MGRPYFFTAEVVLARRQLLCWYMAFAHTLYTGRQHKGGSTTKLYLLCICFLNFSVLLVLDSLGLALLFNSRLFTAVCALEKERASLVLAYCLKPSRIVSQMF